jgi:hypothetical protein
MQHASPSLGAFAPALAKAQAELLNPEKSLVATIPSSTPLESPGKHLPQSVCLMSGGFVLLHTSPC